MPYRVVSMDDSPTPVTGTDINGKEDTFWLKNGDQKDFEKLENREELEEGPARVRVDNINKDQTESDSDDDEDDE